MKELLPNNILETAHFSLATQECLDNSKDSTDSSSLTSGHIINSKYVCLYNHTSLEVVNIENGKRKAAWNFACVDTNQSISCICLCDDKILVALKCQSNSKGRLCIFDPGISCVIKTINISYTPTSIAVVQEFGGAGKNNSRLSPFLKSFFGIVALGTTDGHLMLIDLGLDDLHDSTMSSDTNAQVIDLASNPDMHELREELTLEKSQCTIDLSGSLCSHSGFRYTNYNGKVLQMFAKGTIFVSALRFIENTTSLMVGFDFGCFQIWSLDSLQLIHSSQIGVFSAPVTHFVFQEPDDDPRHCCYIWVGRGPYSDDESSLLAASITLYQLSYEEKKFIKNFGNHYKKIECIIRRFSHQLTSDVHHLVDSISVGSRIISFKNLKGTANGALCYMIWECISEDGTLSCHLGIFDINRWYQKQLPASIREAMYGRMEAVCPFFAFYTLTDVIEHFLPNALLDVVINEKSINNFQTSAGPQNDQFYWPSATSFLLTCVFESGKVTSEILGIQRQIVAEMRKIGTDSFLDAHNLVQSCWIAGLLQNTFDVTRPNTEKKKADAVLSVNFEHNGVGFIINCIRKWSHGSITHAGHSLKLIFDWAWSQVVQRKKLLDQLHLSLFSSLTVNIDHDQHNQLQMFASHMKHLHIILLEIQRSNALTDDAGVSEICDRLLITDHMTKYSNFLLLLVDIGFLPECSQRDLNKLNKNPELIYPNDLMTNFYVTKRANRKQKNQSQLLVDMLLEDILHQSNETLSSKEITFQSYPPSSVEEICDLFVQLPSNGNLHLKLAYYWLLDVSECYEDIKQKGVQNKLQKMAHLKDEEIIFTKSIWLLDHSFKKECVDHISTMKTTFPSSYFAHVVKILHEHDERPLITTLCSLSTTISNYGEDEIKFLLRVYLQLDLLFNAYELQKQYINEETNKKEIIFGYFLDECKENKLLGKLITLSLTSKEEIMLRKYLESSSCHGDYHLVYLLQRGMYLEASRLAKQLESVSAVNLDQGAHDHVVTRRLIVDGFVTTLPTIQQKVMTLSESKLKKQYISPLSTILKNQKEDILHASLALQTDRHTTLQKDETSKKILGNLFSNPRRRKAPLFHGEIVTSPTKKQKEMSDTPKPSLLRSTKRRKATFNGVEAYSLLRTPRMSKHSKLTNTIEVNTKTPQSILKSRTGGARSVSFAAVTDTRKQVSMNEDTPSRKIRFAGLSPVSPLLPSSTLSPAFQQPKSPLVEMLKELEDDEERSMNRSKVTFSNKEMIDDLTAEEHSLDATSLSRDVSYENDTSFDEVKVKNNLTFQFDRLSDEPEPDENSVELTTDRLSEINSRVTDDSFSEGHSFEHISDKHSYPTVPQQREIVLSDNEDSMNDELFHSLGDDGQTSNGNGEMPSDDEETPSDEEKVSHNYQGKVHVDIKSDNIQNDNVDALEIDDSIGEDGVACDGNIGIIRENVDLMVKEEVNQYEGCIEIDSSTIDIYEDADESFASKLRDATQEGINDDCIAQDDTKDSCTDAGGLISNNNSSSIVQSDDEESDSCELVESSDEYSDDSDVGSISRNSEESRSSYEEDIVILAEKEQDLRANEKSPISVEIGKETPGSSPLRECDGIVLNEDGNGVQRYNQVDCDDSDDVVQDSNTPVIDKHNASIAVIDDEVDIYSFDADKVAEEGDTYNDGNSHKNDGVDIYSYDAGNVDKEGDTDKDGNSHKNVDLDIYLFDAEKVDKEVDTDKGGNSHKDDELDIYSPDAEKVEKEVNTDKDGNSHKDDDLDIYSFDTDKVGKEGDTDKDGNSHKEVMVDIYSFDADKIDNKGNTDKDIGLDISSIDADKADKDGDTDKDGNNFIDGDLDIYSFETDKVDKVGDGNGNSYKSDGVDICLLQNVGNSYPSSNEQIFPTDPNDAALGNSSHKEMTLQVSFDEEDNTDVMNSNMSTVDTNHPDKLDIVMSDSEDKTEANVQEITCLTSNSDVEGVEGWDEKEEDSSARTSNSHRTYRNSIIEENNIHLRSRVRLYDVQSQSSSSPQVVLTEDNDDIISSETSPIKDETHNEVSPLDDQDVYPSLFEEVLAETNNTQHDVSETGTQPLDKVVVTESKESSVQQRRSSRNLRSSSKILSSQMKMNENIEAVKRDLNDANKDLIKNPETVLLKPAVKPLEAVSEVDDVENLKSGRRPRRVSRGAKSPSRQDQEVSESARSPSRKQKEVREGAKSPSRKEQKVSSGAKSPSRKEQEVPSSVLDSPSRNTRSKLRMSLAPTKVDDEIVEHVVMVDEREKKAASKNVLDKLMVEPLISENEVPCEAINMNDATTDEDVVSLTKVNRRRTINVPKVSRTLKSMVNTRSKSKNAETSLVDEESTTRRRRTVDAVMSNVQQDYGKTNTKNLQPELSEMSNESTSSESVLSFHDQAEATSSAKHKRASMAVPRASCSRRSARIKSNLLK